MSVRIGHASIDERGRASGGATGDQTGREVCIRDWYNKPWNVMIVCNDKDIAQKAVKYMTAVCNSSHFGYDQSQRTTGYNAIIRAGGKVSDVKNATKSEFDCSSLVASCYKLSGVNVNESNTTSTLRNALKGLKKNGKALFTIYTDSAHVNTSDYAEPGAIYLSEGHHVVMALDYGSKAKKNGTSSGNTGTTSNTKKETKNKISYSVGKTYTTLVELNVRKSPGIDADKKKHSELTADGQKHDKDKDGALDAGTKVTCKDVKIIGSDIWIKTPSGWLAAYYNGKTYIN